MKKKLMAGILAASMALSGITVPSALAEKSSWTENLNRGLTAVKVSNGVYLSWRLQENEDKVFGSADENVSFDIYRNGTKIATESKTTNYIDTAGSASSKYAVVVSGEDVGDEQVSVNTTNYFDIPLVKPADETITSSDGTISNTYSFFPADCSVGDLDGDGEYEIVVKWTSSERDVGSPGDPAYSGTVRLAAYKLDGTRLWADDINLGKNVYSSAHTVQFLVYDFDQDGKAEMICQTSLGSKDANGAYVSNSADPTANSDIYNLTDEENETADYRGDGRIITGEEFLTVFNGETGAAVDTIHLPTTREVKANDKGASYGDDFGNRSNRFLADVAYLDGEQPYAVYMRGYYFGKNGRQRTSIAGISFDGERLSPDYRFDTEKGMTGYYSGAEIYVGQGNHNCTVADVDNDGKDEFITGALCMEVNDNNEFKPKWCTFMEHGDAMHIGDYDPTNDGLEFFTVHEDQGPNTKSGKEVPINYGMSVIDAKSGEILAHYEGSEDTGRGVMANVGAGGYYQIWSAKTAAYKSNGGKNFEQINLSGASQNFRIFWDGDLYDELLDGTGIASWNGTAMSNIFSATGCTKINGTKSNPAIQADLFGDWREEVVYPTTDGNYLRVFTTTAQTNYKIKSLMYDKVYRMGVAAQQTAYNQPPHIGFYLSDDVFYGTLSDIEIDTSKVKTKYYVGEEFSADGLKVTGKYSDNDDKELTEYGVGGYDMTKSGEQTVTVNYMGIKKTYDITVIGESGITAECKNNKFNIGEELDKSRITVKVLYKDGKSKTTDKFTVSDVDNLYAGTQNVDISYKGIEGDYTTNITVDYTTDLVIENGIVTGYNGTDSEVVIPKTIAVSEFDNPVKSIDGSKVTVQSGTENVKVYAAAYDDNNALEKIAVFNVENTNANTYDAGFEIDKVFVWDNMAPVSAKPGETVTITEIAGGAFANSTVSKVHIYSEDIILEDDNIFAPNTTIACIEGSTAEQYASDNGFTAEIITFGDEVTFDEDFYASYAGKNMLMQNTSADATLKDEFITYNAVKCDGRMIQADSYGFAIKNDIGDNYLYVNAGIKDFRDETALGTYITVNEPKSTSEKQTMAFDIMFPTNSGAPYIEIQNDKGTVIDTVSIAALNLKNDTWYRYELVYNSGYTANVYDANGNKVSTRTLSVTAGEQIVSKLVFKQEFLRESFGKVQQGAVAINNMIFN